MIRRPPSSPLFPYTPLFRSSASRSSPGPASAAAHKTGCSNSTRARERNCCRSEEHTSELQSQSNLVCRLLLEKKKTQRERRPSSVPTADVNQFAGVRHHQLY